MLAQAIVAVTMKNLTLILLTAKSHLARQQFVLEIICIEAR